MMDFLSKVRYSVACLIAGILLIFLSQHTLNGAWDKPEIQDRAPTSIPYLIIGILLVLLATLLSLAERDEINLWTKCRLTKTPTGFMALFKETELHIDFGELEKVFVSGSSTVVVLPTSEFFNAECLADPKTAAGAFILARFAAGQSAAVKALIDVQLHGRPCSDALHNGKPEKSYGTGICIYLPQALNSPNNIIFAAVASERDGAGSRTEMVSVFQAISEMHRIIAANRDLSIVFVPLLGSGRGGVPAQLALRALLIAALEARCAQGGHAMKEIHIVVYQRNGGKPAASPRIARRAVRELVTLYREAAR